MSGATPSLDEYKIRARILLKSLRGSDPSRVQEAVERFRRWKPLRGLHAGAPSGEASEIRLKHALAVIALEAGHPSWASLKQSLERADDTERLCPRPAGGFINSWFSSYEEARACHQANGGFLLPYRTHFFVCTAEYIEQALGLDPGDGDWTRIGRDWARPRDLEAWKRLSAKLAPRPT